MPPKPSQESYADMLFPVGGIDRMRSYDRQAPGTTVTGTNVRTYEPGQGRARGGARPPLQKYIASQLPTGAHLIQHLNYIVDPDGEATLDNLDYQDGTLGSDFVADPSEPDLLGVRAAGRFIRRGGDGRARFRSVKKTPRIVWVDPNDMLVEDDIEVDRLNATAEDPNTTATVDGTFTYTPAAGTAMNEVGRIELYVYFSPTFSLTYKPAQKRVHVNVTKRQVTIVWDDPPGISVGDALSDFELNATAKDAVTAATVAGTFTYTPPSGTVMSTAGTDIPLVAHFVPTDTDHFETPADKTVHIDVTSPDIRFIQAVGNSNSLGPTEGILTSVSSTFDLAVHEGSLIVAWIYGSKFTGGPFRPSSITDSQGNTYVQAGSYVDGIPATGTDISASLWYTRTGAAGALTVTAKGTNLLGFDVSMALTMAEYQGVRSAGALDATFGDTLLGTNAAAGPIDISTSGELAVAGLLVGGVADQYTVLSPASLRYSPDPGATFGLFLVMDVIGPAVGTVTLSATAAITAIPQFIVAASFKPG